LLQGEAVVADGLFVAQPRHRLADRQERPDSLRGISIWTYRSQPADFSVYGQVDYGYPDRHRNLRRRDQIGRRYGADLRAGIRGYRIRRDTDSRSSPYVLRRGFRRREGRQSRSKSSLA